MLTGQPPSVYYDLTLRERNAFVMVANKRAQRSRRKNR